MHPSIWNSAVPTAPNVLAQDAHCEGSGWACEPILDLTGTEWVASVVGWLSDKPLKIAVVVLVAIVANKLLRKAVTRGGERMMRSADRVGEFVPSSMRRGEIDTRTEARRGTVSSIATSVTTTIVLVVAVAAVLSVVGVSLTALFASAGVAGVALGFGAQNVVRDVLAGWFIIVEDRYGVGDVIDAGAPAVGVVERVTLRSTRLRDLNGTVWHVANGEVLRVGNMSQNWSRAVVDVVVDPKADIDLACELLGEVGRELAADEHWGEQLTGDPEVLGVHLIDAMGVTLRVMCQTVPASQFQVEREYRRRVLRRYEQAGIPLASMAMLRTMQGTLAPRPDEGDEGPPS